MPHRNSPAEIQPTSGKRARPRGRTAVWLAVALALGGIFGGPRARAATAVVTQALSLQLAALGKLSVPAALTLTNTGAVFNAYGGSLTVQYRVRSTPTGAGGSITVQATGDFAPAGGPAVSSNTLNYTCSGATLGTACGGSPTVSLTSATSILTVPAGVCTGGGGACSAANPNTVNTSFSLVDDPTYKTGSYSATVTFTISST